MIKAKSGLDLLREQLESAQTETGLPFQRVAPRIDARIVVLCFEDGDTETIKDLEIMKAVEMYGNLYVRRMIPFHGGMEVHLSNYAEAGRQ